MAANSLPRQLVKQWVIPLLGHNGRRVLQAASKAKDILDGSWEKREEPELDWVRTVVRPGDIVLDIGANFGLYSYHMSKLVGPSGRVYAFEPIPSTHAALRDVCRLLRLNNVDLIQKGCGATSETVTFSVPLQENGTFSAGLAFISMDPAKRQERLAKSSYQATEDVVCDVVAIDDYLPSLPRLSLIKCDIEGADLLAMRGARKTIEKHRPPIMIEIEERYLESYGLSKHDVMSFFGSLDYRMYRWRGGRLIPQTVDDITSDNWIFLPDEQTH